MGILKRASSKWFSFLLSGYSRICYRGHIRAVNCPGYSGWCLFLIRTENLLCCSRTALIRLYRNSSQCLIFKCWITCQCSQLCLHSYRQWGVAYFYCGNTPPSLWVLHIYGKGPLKDGIFFRLQMDKRVRISWIEAGAHNRKWTILY